MANKLTLSGLDELRAALRQLPAELVAEAGSIIDHTAEITASSLKQSYPLGDSGNLRAGVKVETHHSQLGTVGTVRSTSKHAHLWEFGTMNRKTRQGWGRGRAPSNKPDGLVQIAQRNRKRMNQQLVDVVRKAGFMVSGDL